MRSSVQFTSPICMQLVTTASPTSKNRDSALSHDLHRYASFCNLQSSLHYLNLMFSIILAFFRQDLAYFAAFLLFQTATFPSSLSCAVIAMDDAHRALDGDRDTIDVTRTYVYPPETYFETYFETVTYDDLYLLTCYA